MTPFGKAPRRNATVAALTVACFLIGFAATFAHKAHAGRHYSQRCPLVDGRGGNFDSARTDVLMKDSRCWLTI